MAKHGIEGDPDDYCLVQLIPGGGIHVIFVLFKIFINNVLSCLIGIQIFPQANKTSQSLTFRNIQFSLKKLLWFISIDFLK